MAKVKLPDSVKDADTSGDWTPVKPGMYIAEVAEVNDWSKSEAAGGHGDGMELVLKILSNSKGETKGVEGIGSQLWRYVYFDYEPTVGMLAEVLDATGQKRTGTLDTNKMVGKKVQVRVKSGKNMDGEYRAEVGKILSLAQDAPEPEPGDEPEPEAEPEGDVLDLDTLDRNDLKKLIKDQELGTLADLGINAKTTDDAIRDIIAEKLGGEEEPEPEPEEEPEPELEPEPEPEPEPEDDGLEIARDALKMLIKEEGLGSLIELGINRATTDDEIRDIIRGARGGDEPEPEPEDEPEAEAGSPDYSKYSPEMLKAELKERGIEMEGRFSKAKAIKTLREDDGDDGEPF